MAAPYQIVAGPATVFIAPTGTPFPAIAAATTGWLSLGHTDGGVKVKHVQTITYEPGYDDGAPIKARRTSEGLTITFVLAESTLERFSTVLDSAALTTGAAEKSIVLAQSYIVQKWSMLVRGPSPYMDNAFMQYEIPVVVQGADPEVVFVKDKYSGLDCEFNALADLSGGARFGRLRAQTS
jgi:hypothetical protein